MSKKRSEIVEKPYMSINDTALLLGVSRKTLDDRLKAHRLPGRPEGRKFSVNVPLLKALLDAESKAGLSAESRALLDGVSA